MWTPSHKIVFVIIVLLCIHYVAKVALDKFGALESPDTTEGFDGEATGTITKLNPTDNTLYSWVTDTQLIYDDFYAGVYDQLCQQSARSQAKVAVLMSMWGKQTTPKEMVILDAGCGTGHATLSFAKMNCGRVIGMDYAPAMLKQAETVVQPAAKLSEAQNSVVRWRQDSLINPSACSAGEFTHIVCFYFTYYYLKNQEEFFRHMNLWSRPGGKLALEVVNKHKFDPILESASPFVAFSLQKYSKERLRKSKVTFDKFDYEAEFVLSDPKAEFYETFRFKNGHVKRQKHQFLMPNISAIVDTGKRAGWKYIGSQDLNPIGFEYGYLLLFEK
jgi:SAM-dependent methyltransferase